MKQRLFFVFFSLMQCFYSFGMQLDVVRVGPANCTVFKMNNKALIYDCGYSSGNWISSGRFAYDKRILFSNIMRGIEEVGIVISHDDADHKNLLPAISEFLGEKRKFVINITNQDTLPVVDLCQLQMFFGSDFRVYPIIPDFRGDTRSITTNDKSLILKIAGVTGEGEGYSFLMTGDATKKTFDKIAVRQVISWDNPSIVDNAQYWKDSITNLFTDVVCFMPAHHGTDTENSLVWSDYVLRHSSFPVLTIISSDPSVRNQSPTLQTICSLNDMIVSNLQRTENYKKYFCVPHDIDCYYEAFSIVDDSLKFTEDNSLQVIKYPSLHGGFIVPMFVTSNSQSGIYTISLNHDLSMTLFDNTVQLYGMHHDADFTLLSGVCTAYMHYYSQKKLDSLGYHAALLQDNIEQELVAAKGENFGSYLETFIRNQTAIIRKTKILSYLSKVIPLLQDVIESTAAPLDDLQHFNRSNLYDIDKPFGREYLQFLFDSILKPEDVPPQDILSVLFAHYFQKDIDFSNSMLIDAAVSALRTQYPGVNDSNFGDFLTLIGVANERNPYQEFLYSRIVQ